MKVGGRRAQQTGQGWGGGSAQWLGANSKVPCMRPNGLSDAACLAQVVQGMSGSPPAVHADVRLDQRHGRRGRRCGDDDVAELVREYEGPAGRDDGAPGCAVRDEGGQQGCVVRKEGVAGHRAVLAQFAKLAGEVARRRIGVLRIGVEEGAQDRGVLGRTESSANCKDTKRWLESVLVTVWV